VIEPEALPAVEPAPGAANTGATASKTTITRRAAGRKHVIAQIVAFAKNWLV